MTAIFTLDAQVRTDLGKGASRRLRHANKVPAILYGADEQPVSLTLEHSKVLRAQQEEAFYSHILTLNVDGKKVECLLKDMQRHPYKPVIMHMDLLRVKRGQELSTNVPVHFINEDVAEKTGAVLIHNATEIAITCLPKDLPEFIEVDVAGLVIGESIHLSQITLPKGVSADELAKGEDHDIALITATAPKADKSADAAGEEEASAE